MAPMCLTDNGAKKGEIGTPLGAGRTILANMNVCAPMCAMGELGQLQKSGRWLAKMEAGVSCRISSQMWGSWYFPSFLLRDGSFTLMNIAFLMVLGTP